MKATLYTEYGPPEVLRPGEVETPTPEANEIRVRVRATTVNYGDLIARNFRNVSMRAFNMPAPFYLPARMSFGFWKPSNPILGSEFAGDVEAVSQDVTRFRVGDAVYGYLGPSMGAYAEYLCIAEDGMVALKPANLSYEEAAAVPYGAMTALNLLRSVDIQPGDKVLINGASGAIGSYAVQIARQAGAEVTSVCGTRRMDFVEALGADHVIDYTQEDFTRNGQTYDLIFDILGRSSFATCKGPLSEDGVYLLASFKMLAVLQMLWTARAGRQKVICAMSSEKRDDLITINEMVEAGILTSIVDRCYPLDQAAEAHRYVEEGRKQGNVVITVGQPA